MIFLMWLALILLLFTLPILLGVAFPQLQLVIAVIIVLSIYSLIRQYFGDGLITIILTLAAAYYLVYKNFWITASIWWIYLVLATSAFSALGWTFITLTQLFKRKG